MITSTPEECKYKFSQTDGYVQRAGKAAQHQRHTASSAVSDEQTTASGARITMADLAAAIKRVETSRETHVAWRDYWLERPECNNCEKCQADMAIAGDLERQERLIREYDNVLEVLHTYEKRLRGSAW